VHAHISLVGNAPDDFLRIQFFGSKQIPVLGLYIRRIAHQREWTVLHQIVGCRYRLTQEAFGRSLQVQFGVILTISTFEQAYTRFESQTTDKWILEVRRERGIELAFEGLRYDDIMRWKLGKLIERTWQGIYIAQKGQTYDLNGDGIYDVAYVDKAPADADKVKGVDYVVLDGDNYRLSEGDHGYVEYGMSQNRTWLDKKYLRPVPLDDIQINPALLPQNPGWD